MNKFSIAILLIGIIYVIFILHNRKKTNLIIKTALIVTVLACSIIIIVSFKFFAFISGNNKMSLAIASVIILLYVVIRLANKIYKLFQVRDSEDEGIYIRDMDVKYSPAILSFLQNQKIEKEKDIMACILDLCAKNYLNIAKKIENTYALEEGTNKNIQLLPNDERYLYDKIMAKEKINFYKWKEIVINEFNKYGFFKYKHISVTVIYFIIFMVSMLVYAIIYASRLGDIPEQILMSIFFTLLEIAILEPCFILISKFLKIGEKNISGIYTTKGIKEIKRWNKYRNFLKDYTLVKDRKIDSVVVLEKHIAYATVLDVNKEYTNSIIEDLKFNYELDLECLDNILKDIGENYVRL